MENLFEGQWVVLKTTIAKGHVGVIKRLGPWKSDIQVMRDAKGNRVNYNTAFHNDHLEAAPLEVDASALIDLALDMRDKQLFMELTGGKNK